MNKTEENLLFNSLKKKDENSKIRIFLINMLYKTIDFEENNNLHCAIVILLKYSFSMILF